jgi:asparagine synthase (glutamine-hydrolysing)
MCGFAALVSLSGAPIDVTRLGRMTRALVHRGPDDEGYLLACQATGQAIGARGRDTIAGVSGPSLAELGDRSWTVGLGVRRLAIRAPGPEGRQPMATPDGRLWVALNGELYGDGGVRGVLSAGGWRFASPCDTETLLAAWRAWGAGALARLNGMFACAVWDGARRCFTAARDSFGIKPLYYAVGRDAVLIGSEIKAILAGLDETPRPEWPVVLDYVAWRTSDHTDATFFEGIRQVPPRSLLAIADGQVRLSSWADADGDRLDRDAAGTREAGAPAGAAFHRAFDAAVDDHLESDARVGATLSGGLDSTSIVMAASRSGARGAAPFDVFTAVFDQPGVDERRYARAAAEAAHARLHLVPIEPRALIDDLPRVLWHQDEPMVSTSVLAQWQVMKRVAAAGVRVVLDGQGADELLAGYPALIGAHLADLFRTGAWGRLFREARSARTAGLGSLPALLGRACLEPIPAPIRSVLTRLVQRQLHGVHPDLAGYWRPAPRASRSTGPDALMEAALATLTRSSLPALLRYLDRNGMAWSIEPRVPFLDRRVTAASRALGSVDRFQDGVGKAVLRDARWSRLPPLVAARRDKIAFATPEQAWWRGPLRTWAADVLDPASVARHGVLDPAIVARVRDGLSRGDAEPPAALWRWINIELWMHSLEQRAAGAA